MFLRHTRENENGASALITVGADQQSFKTTDCTDFTQIITDGSWKFACIHAHSRGRGNPTHAGNSDAKREPFPTVFECRRRGEEFLVRIGSGNLTRWIFSMVNLLIASAVESRHLLKQGRPTSEGNPHPKGPLGVKGRTASVATAPFASAIACIDNVQLLRFEVDRSIFPSRIR